MILNGLPCESKYLADEHPPALAETESFLNNEPFHQLRGMWRDGRWLRRHRLLILPNRCG